MSQKKYRVSARPKLNTGMWTDGTQGRYFVDHDSHGYHGARRVAEDSLVVRQLARPVRPQLSLAERRKRACYGY